MTMVSLITCNRLLWCSKVVTGNICYNGSLMGNLQDRLNLYLSEYGMLIVFVTQYAIKNIFQAQGVIGLLHRNTVFFHDGVNWYK